MELVLKLLNPLDTWYDSLVGGSPHCKACIYTGQHNRRNVEIFPCPKRGWAAQNRTHLRLCGHWDRPVIVVE